MVTMENSQFQAISSNVILKGKNIHNLNMFSNLTNDHISKRLNLHFGKKRNKTIYKNNL